jgi:hypothetical protein
MDGLDNFRKLKKKTHCKRRDIVIFICLLDARDIYDSAVTKARQS